VTINPNPGVLGFVTNVNEQWLRQVSDDGTVEVFVPQFVMVNGPQGYHQNQSVVNQDINTFLNQHGFTGVHSMVLCRWFDLNEPKCTNISGNPSPDPRTFEALELLITKVHAAGGVVHLWAWGDQGRGQTPKVWGINGSEDKRLQRYIAARLGPGLWAMGSTSMNG